MTMLMRIGDDLQSEGVGRMHDLVPGGNVAEHLQGGAGLVHEVEGGVKGPLVRFGHEEGIGVARLQEDLANPRAFEIRQEPQNTL
ncbi:hypothetical protein [Streptomyces sp. RPT161]|uniref:hypothetical protein n=1 Tax=Streptomyces sp. RPT161 TaxID=3015993 RepID=UPI0022B8CBA6|nr:hypothetical protein [Streptomyces sp. RPT161]